ncbi:MAG: MarR family winged helix-turn-helix transcriptional regulator [Dysgonomonas sp.]
MDIKDNNVGNCQDIGFLIWQITKYWTRGKHRSLDEFGLTGSQMEMLGAIHHLSKTNNEVTQILLSQETLIDPMTTSTILRNMEKKGLITRTESKTDTRARTIQLTDAGNELLHKALGKIKKLQVNLFESVDTSALREQLIILLETVKKIYNLNN